MDRGESDDSTRSEGEYTCSTEPTKYLCKQAEDKAKFRGRGLGFSTITAIHTIFVEEEQGREAENQVLWFVHNYQEIRRSGI
jgi:hypothetical protein